MKKIILLIGIVALLFIVGCSEQIELTKCSISSQLSSGNFLVINGYKASLLYNDSKFTDCCCDNKEAKICVCKELEIIE